MNAKATVFSQEGKNLWSKDLADNRTIYSVCVEVNNSVLDMATLFERNEKSMIWLKGEDEARLLEQQSAVIKQINNGILLPYRQFSTTPFYYKPDGEPQDPDINPTTGELLGRYSQVRLCPASKHAELHRQYVVVSTEPAVAEPQPKIEAGTE